MQNTELNKLFTRRSTVTSPICATPHKHKGYATTYDVQFCLQVYRKSMQFLFILYFLGRLCEKQRHSTYMETTE